MVAKLYTNTWFESLRDSQNKISDDRNITTHQELYHGVMALDKYFETQVTNKVSCVCVTLQNNIGYTAVMLTLILKKINFFLLTGNDKDIPHFCDHVLRLKESHGNIQEINHHIELKGNPNFNQSANVLPRSGAVLFASSGTTGAPKYVCYRSENLIENARKCIDRFNLDHSKNILIPVPVNHMFGFGAGLLPALLAGANICLIEKNNIVRLLQKLISFKPHFTLLTPAVCKMLLILDKDVEKTGIFISAGDKINKQTYIDFESKFGKLINLYGCTEMGAMATSALDANLENRANGSLLPMSDVNVTINGQEKKGEILCMRDDSFDFYIDKNGTLLNGNSKESLTYHTKDLGERASDGSFRIVGRVDNCTNRNGFLVSLREVEILLEEIFSEITQGIVFESDDQTIMGQRLIAICELKDINQQPSDRDVRAKCLHKMPTYWVPDQFYFVPELPRLSNGKPDRVSLIKNYKSTSIT